MRKRVQREEKEEREGKAEKGQIAMRNSTLGEIMCIQICTSKNEHPVTLRNK